MASRDVQAERSDAGFLFDAGQLIGRVLDDRYRIDAVLASGGMGLVCRGTDLRIRRAVAIKLLKPHSGMEERTVKRFFREVEIAARLRHPHIVDVLDYGTLAGGTAPFLIMELLSGRSLDGELAERERLGAAEALELLLPIMGALASVHGAGVVHRDVKPANIFLHRDPYGRLTPKLLDFGIAKEQGSETHTSTHALMGTPAYMAPEQVGNRAVGPRTDVWAMGAVLYRCLGGAAPLAGATPAETIARVATELAPPLRVDGLHRGLSAAIDRALLRDPDDRYPDMPAFCAALVGSAHAAGISVKMPPSVTLPSEALAVAATDRTVSLHLPDGPDATVDTMEVRRSPTDAEARRPTKGPLLIAGGLAALGAAALIGVQWAREPAADGDETSVRAVQPAPASSAGVIAPPSARPKGTASEPVGGRASDRGARKHDTGAEPSRGDRSTTHAASSAPDVGAGGPEALPKGQAPASASTRASPRSTAADRAKPPPSPARVEANAPAPDDGLPVAVEW